MRHAERFVALSFILALGAAPVLAQKGHGNGPVAKPQAQAHPAGKPADAPKPQVQQPTGPKAPTQHAAVPKTTGGNPHKTPMTGRSAPARTPTSPTSPAAITGRGAPAKTPTTTPPTALTGMGAPPATPAVTPTTSTSVKVKNPRLEQRLMLLLPAGTNVADASRGFKNWGQFVAAVHVSHNLNIPFAELKARMTGIPPGTVLGNTTLTTPMSLGQAIQSFKTSPSSGMSSTVQTQVHRAESEAEEDLRVAADDHRR